MPMQSEQISEEYRRMQEQLHQNPQYGVASVQYAPVVAKIMQQTATSELLDYGAGKGRLGETLKQLITAPLNIHHYDPARPEWAEEPSPCGFVCCIDVLEHIEPNYLDSVLDHLKRLVMKRGFFTVHTGPAIKVLPDGRNAHLIQESASWWLPKIMQRFDLTVFQKMPQGFWVLVERKPEKPILIEPV